jgi:SNF family Na+-dependent transporter
LLFFYFLVSLKSISQYFSTVCLSVGNTQLCTEHNIKLQTIIFVFFVLFNLIAVFVTNTSTYNLLLLFDQVNCNLLLVIFVLIEVVVIIWFSFNHLVYHRIGKAPVMFHYMTWFIGWALCGILTVLFPLWVALVSAVIVAFGGLCLSVIWSKKRRGSGFTYWQCLTYLTIFNTETLRWVLNAYYCKNSLLKIPVLWTYTIKYITSAILTAFAFSEFYRFA